jgi:hypothetical protein
MYFVTMYMDFYFNISMDFTYVEKYYTLTCFHFMFINFLSKSILNMFLS